jgi:hypothetical protein
MPMTPKVTHHPFAVSVQDERFLVSWWLEAPNAASLTTWQRSIRAFLGHEHRPTLVVNLCPAHLPPPHKDASPVMAETVDLIGSKGGTLGLVFLARGFRASALRTVVAAVGLVSKGARHTIVASDVEDLVAKIPKPLADHGEALRKLCASAEAHGKDTASA